MAKEHRAALREVLLMGVTRLVVDKGEIEAGVEFSVKAPRESKAHHDDQNINVANVETSLRAAAGRALRRTQRQPVDVEHEHPGQHVGQEGHRRSVGHPEGKGKIEFKTDYFKLDNFANMYADGGVAALKPPAGRDRRCRARHVGAIDRMALAILELVGRGRRRPVPDRHRTNRFYQLKFGRDVRDAATRWSTMSTTGRRWPNRGGATFLDTATEVVRAARPARRGRVYAQLFSSKTRDASAPASRVIGGSPAGVIPAPERRPASSGSSTP